MKTYIIKYETEDEIEAENKLEALIIHQDALSYRLGDMLKQIVWEKEEEK